MLEHRERLRQRGVLADALQPEWCRLNENQCYLSENRDGHINAGLVYFARWYSNIGNRLTLLVNGNGDTTKRRSVTISD